MAITQEEVVSAENNRLRALKDKDIAGIEAVLSDDLTYTHSFGLVEGKADVVAKVKSKHRYLAIERGDLRVELFGDCAVMTGRIFLRTIAGEGEPVMEMDGQITQTWAKQSGQVRMVAYHVSKLKKS